MRFGRRARSDTPDLRAREVSIIARLFPSNVHLVERGVRVLIGVGLLSLLLLGPVPGWGLIGVVGLLPLFTGATGTCPAYTLLGVSTRSEPAEGA